MGNLVFTEYSVEIGFSKKIRSEDEEHLGAFLRGRWVSSDGEKLIRTLLLFGSLLNVFFFD